MNHINITSMGAACAVLLFTHSSLQAQKSPEDKNAATFQRWDTNGDGSLSKDEFMATKEAKKNPESAAQRFTRFDKDGNGSLSKREFTKAPAGGKKVEGKKGKEGKQSEGAEEAEE